MTNSTHISPVTRRAAAALAASMILLPATAQAKPVDTVGGAAKQPVVTSQDFRSPDARDASQPTPKLHSEVGVDEALAQERSYSSYGDPKPITTVHTATPTSSDFDWPSAGIGAGIAMAVALLGFTAFALSTGRRTGRGALVS